MKNPIKLTMFSGNDPFVMSRDDIKRIYLIGRFTKILTHSGETLEVADQYADLIERCSEPLDCELLVNFQSKKSQGMFGIKPSAVAGLMEMERGVTAIYLLGGGVPVEVYMGINDVKKKLGL